MSAGEKRQHRVTVLGSGNFGSAVAQLLGENVLARPELFEREVRMWVFEEQFEGRSLTELINERHENVKYLPGHKLPDNVVAVSDVVAAVSGASLLVVVMPHQFAGSVCRQVRPHLAADVAVISLLKGMAVSDDGRRPVLLSDYLCEQLSDSRRRVPVAVLSGANIADEVAKGPLSEATIGCRDDAALCRTWWSLFHCARYRVAVVDDVAGVELCGALKNVVALAAGICDGLKTGGNAKAAMIRIGLQEMRAFAGRFFAGVRDATFFESAGVADLIVTSFSGRNRKVAEAHALTGKPFDQLEREMLNGQKLQGTHTAREVYQILSHSGDLAAFPLFTAVYRIVYEGAPPVTLFSLGTAARL